MHLISGWQKGLDQCIIMFFTTFFFLCCHSIFKVDFLYLDQRLTIILKGKNHKQDSPIEEKAMIFISQWVSSSFTIMSYIIMQYIAGKTCTHANYVI